MNMLSQEQELSWASNVDPCEALAGEFYSGRIDGGCRGLMDTVYSSSAA